jgi:GNAT superfamily N-acetyltransferase
VREIGAISYAKYFGDSLPKILNYYAGRRDGASGAILCAFMSGKPCGALVTGRSGKGEPSILYAAVLANFRRQGVFGELVRSALRMFKSSGADRAVAKNTLAPPMREEIGGFFKKTGFVRTASVVTVINHYNDLTRAEFREFMRTRGERFESRLAKRGYEAKSFDGATERELGMLKRDIGVKYPADLNPFRVIDRITGRVSHIVYKDRRPIAYCALSSFEGDKRVSEVSCRACAPERKNSGAALLALMKCLEASFLHGMHDRTLFSFYSDNIEMQNLMKNPLVKFTGNSRHEADLYEIDLMYTAEVKRDEYKCERR